MKASCHTELDVYCKGLCRNCYEKQLRENNPEYAKRQKENSKNWHIKNKKHKKEYDRNRRSIIGPETEKRFLNHIFNCYGLSKDAYDKMMIKCEGKCMLCKQKPKKKLHIDHDHTTGKIRGLLCARCNWFLAVVEKDKTILNRIKTYLKK